jgi:arylsulfatase A-like enzyme
MRIVLITLDDVSFYSLGFVGFFPDFTPNINKFAEESYAFWNAHCNIPFCEPSRSVLMTGLYPQNNKSTCFVPIGRVPHISQILKGLGYCTVLCGKNFHYKNMYWDVEFKNKNYDEALKYALGFNDKIFLSINLHFAHRQFETPENMDFPNFPNFLPRTKVMEEEMSAYLATLKKADELVGKIVDSFDKEDIVILTSDHGMSFPYVKGDCYGTSTNIPFIIRNDKILKKHDKINLISHVDFLPTMAEWLNFEGEFDGDSYYSLLTKDTKRQNQVVYAQLNRMFDGPDCRIRSLIKKDICYTINLDQLFPGWCVDGWGWDKPLKEMDASYCLRPIEQLLRYEKLNIFPIEDDKMKLEMRKELFELMTKYNDPEVICAKKRFLKQI